MSTKDRVLERLQTIKEAGQWRSIERPKGLDFSHNSYLGLSRHPEIIDAGEKALQIFGAGSRGSRLLGGGHVIFDELENQIAEFFKAPASVFFSSGYLANLAALQTASGLVDWVLSDERNHASLIDGIRLSGKPKEIVPHQNWPILKEKGSPFLAVTESLFSMDGDTLNLGSFQKIIDHPEALLLIDEAHAAGVLLDSGRGVLEKSPIDWDKTLITVTFGKAFGVGGAAVLCSENFRNLLINEGRPFIYTTAPSPVLAAMVSASISVVEKESWRREALWDLAKTFRKVLHEGLGEKNFPLPSGWDLCTPIVPICLSGNRRVIEYCRRLNSSQLGVRAIRYPTVAKGGERVRVSLNLDVSRENIALAAAEMVRVWKEFS